MQNLLLINRLELFDLKLNILSLITRGFQYLTRRKFNVLSKTICNMQKHWEYFTINVIFNKITITFVVILHRKDIQTKRYLNATRDKLSVLYNLFTEPTVTKGNTKKYRSNNFLHSLNSIQYSSVVKVNIQISKMV